MSLRWLIALLPLAGCYPQHRIQTQSYYPVQQPVYVQPAPQPCPTNDPFGVNQFLSDSSAQFSQQPMVSVPMPQEQNPIIESRQRIEYMRTQGGRPGYAQGPYYRSAQEQIDAETSTADPTSAYDRHEVAKIKARVNIGWAQRAIQQRTGKPLNTKHTTIER